jgi:hypothetical protein
MAQTDDRLPVMHRTIRLPGPLWNAVKERSRREAKPVRLVVEEALDAELIPLIDALRALGLDGDVKSDKLVRLPVDDNVIGRISFGRRQTTVAAVQILTMCLQRHVERRRRRRRHGL